MVLCPECGEELEPEEPYEGQRLQCPRCRARLEILNLEPLEVDWAYNDPDLFEMMEDIQAV